MQLLGFLGAEKNFAADFRAEKSQEGLRRKRNDRVFEARRRLLHPHFGLGSKSKATNKKKLKKSVTSEPEMRVKDSSASFKNNNFENPWPEINRISPVISFSAKSFLTFFRP